MTPRHPYRLRDIRRAFRLLALRHAVSRNLPSMTPRYDAQILALARRWGLVRAHNRRAAVAALRQWTLNALLQRHLHETHTRQRRWADA